MAKNNPSLADLSRMRREAKQSNNVETPQKSHLEEAKTVEMNEQTSAVQNYHKSSPSNDKKREIFSKQKPSETEELKKVGRPKGIRSNPDYESTTIRLHKKIKAKARYILSTQPEKMDLQTLLNNLLEDFVREQDI